MRVTVYALALVREKSNGTDDRREDRLRVQGGADRRLCGGEVADFEPIRAKRVLTRLESDDWSRVSDANARDPAQERQGSDLGHRRPGEVLFILI